MVSKLLVIDDEEALCEILKYNLERNGYEVDTAYSAEEALTMDLPSYDLIIADIMMEKLSGFDFAREVRNNTVTETIPIIFCSALDGEDDTVCGLNLGADDYITKPFVISEVLARVRAVLRRSQIKNAVAAAKTAPAAEDIYVPDIVFEGLRLDMNQKVVYLDDEPVSLTKTEFEILLFFLTHRNRVYTREEIISSVWPGNGTVTARAIDTNINRLRRKIGRYSNNIVTRLGFGYGFKETY
ncbi:MAG: response regulator transcription factor [Muribaculaceae bacterium]|nr:response regulator transcription factor [Muribaculaceae bacterium]